MRRNDGPDPQRTSRSPTRTHRARHRLLDIHEREFVCVLGQRPVRKNHALKRLCSAASVRTRPHLIDDPVPSSRPPRLRSTEVLALPDRTVLDNVPSVPKSRNSGSAAHAGATAAAAARDEATTISAARPARTDAGKYPINLSLSAGHRPGAHEQPAHPAMDGRSALDPAPAAICRSH
jgi:hypothetical protein